MSSTPSPTPSRRIFKTGLLLSLVFHLAAIGMLVWMAAREGLIGLPRKQVAVSLLREPPPHQPPDPEKPQPEAPKTELPVFSDSVLSAAPTSSPEKTAPVPSLPFVPPQTVPAVPSPAPADLPSFAFEDGGDTVQTSTDPAGVYRSYVEFNLRSRWNRPADIADEHYVAEIEIAVDTAGRLSDPRWKPKSGDARWDASVMAVITQTRNLDRSPPPGFPAKLTIRFDVVPSGELPAE